MSARKLDKLEQRLYRTMKEIKEATGPRELMSYIHRLGRLEEQYKRLSGARFYPQDDHDSVQDIEWR